MRDPIPDKRFQFYSTQTVPLAARVSYWNDLTCDTFTGVTVDPVRSSEFSARLGRLSIGEMSLAEVWSAGSNVRHTEGHVRRLREEPHMLLHLQLSGSSINRQAGREACLQAGDFTLCDTSRPYTVAFNSNAQFLIGRLPTQAVRQRLPNAEDLVAVRIARAAGTSALMCSFLRTIMTEAQSSQSAVWCDDISAVALDLIAMMIRAHSPVHASSLHLETRHDRVVAYIETHLSDPALSVQSIAQEFGVGVRSIQKMFAVRGTTLSEQVLQRRLKLAAARLGNSSLSVTEVAMDSGFNDLTYFGRVFRKSFGVAPREYRRVNR